MVEQGESKKRTNFFVDSNLRRHNIHQPELDNHQSWKPRRIDRNDYQLLILSKCHADIFTQTNTIKIRYRQDRNRTPDFDLEMTIF